MDSLAFATIKSLKSALESKKISAVELRAFLRKRFETYDKDIGSALELFEEDTLVAQETGPLAGIPGLIKDNICQKDRITSCASKILQNYKAPYNATAITRLDDAGAIRLGRANCDEFAMGSSNETSAFQVTRNPWDFSRVPGGSSGGSIAAVAAGLVPWSLGSETGGSVRQPAAFCGIVGLKPTYGLVSRYGLIAYASSLDQIGPATRCVYDNALVLSAIAGHDTHDSSSLPVKSQDYTRLLTGKLKEGCTIGVIDNTFEGEGFDEEVRTLQLDAVKQFERLGAKIKHVRMPMMDHAAAVYFILSRAEAASNLARFDGVRYGYRSKDATSLTDMYTKTRSEGFGLEVKSRILIGNYVLSVGHAEAFYKSAKIVQASMRQEYLEVFKSVDFLFAPSSAGVAFKFGEVNGLQMDLMDYFFASNNLTGTPALAIPCGFTKEKLPVGFQLIGPDLSEAELYQAAYAYEQSMPWHTMHPNLP